MNTYPEMNKQIVGLLRISDNPVDLYAAQYIEELQKELEKHQWISVDDRLPKLGEIVNVYLSEHPFFNRRVGLCSMIISSKTDIPYWDIYDRKVLAWMPLPEPPKNIQEDE